MGFSIRTVTAVLAVLILSASSVFSADTDSSVVVVSKDSARPGGLVFRRKQVNPGQAEKLKSDPAVIAVLPNKPIEVPPVPGPHITWDDMIRRVCTAPTAADQIQPNTWLAKDVHGAPAVWNMGYTGAGVKVAVVDEGVDFGHPDLQGCQARVSDPSSPYYGWPIAFDPQAMARYALTGVITSGYSDTKATITGTTSGKFQGRTYTLTGTSKSGVYHIGRHPSYWLPFLIGTWGAPAAVLVVDENTPGVYDTVYVDINKNFDFSDDKPCRRGDEISYWDKNSDGLADFSGGMVYFIADGVNPIPASDWLYQLPPPANGCLVAFAGSFGKYDSHGTLVASAIAARGKVGTSYGLPQKPAGSGGMVYGMAPGAGIIQVGNIYESYADLYDAIQFCVLGYDGKPNTGDEADIVNMSFSISDQDNDGWDLLSRYITKLNETVAPKTTFVAAIGNGGPGYGTVSSPGGAANVVTVGVGTLYGSTDAYNPIGSADQILFGDIQQWSDRGPNSLGQIKPDVAAIGAWATGDVPIYGDGENSWGIWGGSSLSAPITSGVLALIYEAYRSTHGIYPDHKQAKAILMAGANDLKYNVLEQGAGMIDAERSTRIAAETGGLIVDPPSWAAGRRNDDAPAFPHVMRQGQVDQQQFQIKNTGPTDLTVTLSGSRLLRTGSSQFTVTTNNALEDLEASQVKPDYIIDLTNSVPEGTDLLRIRVSFPYDSFSLVDPSSNFLKSSSKWMVSLLDWSDLNKNGGLWTDANGNGAVNEGEFEDPEVNPFQFGLAACDVIEVSAKDPLKRTHDGLLLGLHHASKNSLIGSTTLKVEMEFYREVNWDWLSVPKKPVVVPAGQTVQVPVRMKTPNNCDPGVYVGSLKLMSDNETTSVPVSVTIAAHVGMINRQNQLIKGSDDIGDTYDNGKMLGSFDWGWREESGDWRFYFIDVPENRLDQTSFILANAKWTDSPSDTDILIYKPNTADDFSKELPEVFGPYGMTLSGSSKRTHTAAGIWPFNTSTGGPSEWVAGEAAPGLNLVQLHNVLSSGKAASEPINLTAGQVWLEPGKIELAPGQTSAVVQVTSSIKLPGLASYSFGFASPVTETGLISRGDPIDDPSTAHWKKDFTLGSAGMIEFTLDCSDASADLDLYLLYDSNSDGFFDWTYEIAAVSASQSASEHILMNLPKSGNYRLAIYAFRAKNAVTFTLRTLMVTGKDIKVSIPSGEIKNGCPKTLQISFPPAPAGAKGIIFLGPPEAPGVIPLPVEVKDLDPSIVSSTR